MSKLVADTVDASEIDPAELVTADISVFETEFDRWLQRHSEDLQEFRVVEPDFGRRVDLARRLQHVLFTAGWARCGWPLKAGGLGGDVRHRALTAERLIVAGYVEPTVFEHVEILGPTLCERVEEDLLLELFPRYLDGSICFAQGFSEPEAGSDLASIRTRATVDGDSFVITGRKIWTSWAKYAQYCVLLARTGPPDSKHRGLTMMIVPLDSEGVEVSAVVQANGTDELAEVVFDEVRVPRRNVLGGVNHGWAVAMDVLGRERGTISWFRQCHMHHRLNETLMEVKPEHDTAVGSAIVALAALRTMARETILGEYHGVNPGVRGTFNKVAMTCTEQDLYQLVRWVYGPSLLLDNVDGALMEKLRQEYLFSTIVSVYGGSRQMQLSTIANRVLGLPR